MSFEVDKEIIENKSKKTYEAQIECPDGLLRDVLFNKAVHLDEDGNVKGIVGSMRDITDQKEMDRQIIKRDMIKDLVLSISKMISNQVYKISIFDILIKGLVGIFKDAHYGSVLEITDESYLVIISSSGYEKNAIEEFKIPLKESIFWKLSFQTRS